MDVLTGETIENSVILIAGDRIVEVGVVEKIQIPASARRIDASGKWIVPGLMDMHAHVTNEPDLPFEMIADYGLVIDPADAINDPNNRFLPEEVFEAWKSYPQPEVYKVPQELKAASAASFQKRMKFVGLCSQAGVRIITGTDGAGLGNLLPGFALHRELRMLSEAGMNPLDILRATTITSAEALGKEYDLGSVEKGKFADLLILQKDPLLDIKNLDSIVSVFKGGREFQPEVLLRKKEVIQ